MNGLENLAVQLAHTLKEEIYRGKHLSGKTIPSERDLSEAYKLSRTTVRRAIESLVEEGILERRPGSGTFVSAIGTPTSTTSTLGLIVPTLVNPYYGELSNAVESFAREQGYQLLIGQSDYNFSNENAYLNRYADERSVKGVIVVPNVDIVSAGAYSKLQEIAKPFVFLGRWPEGTEADRISSDYRSGAKAIISYLISLGHTKIAYIEGNPHVNENPLLQGYYDALQEANIAIVSERVIILNKAAEQAGFEGVAQLLNQDETITAVFARNDLTASSVIQGLIKAGRNIPSDVSVVGFDSTQLASHLSPKLTTVDTTLKEIGRQALMMLLDRISGRYDGPSRQILIQPRLIIRDSCSFKGASSN